VARDWRDERIEELEAENKALRERIEKLEALLKLNSSNSNRPPSSDSPEDREKRRKARNKRKNQRKRGAQPGHAPKSRTLVDEDKVTKFEDCVPQDCERCHAPLPAVVDAEPLRHQVVDVPPIEPEVHEYRLHSAECEECGHATRAKLPVGVPNSMFGPRLLGLIGLLTGDYRLSRRRAVTFLNDVLGIQVSLGALSEAEERVSNAVAPAVDEAREFVLDDDIKHIDATSWSTAGKARTLWTLATTLVAVFAITLDGKKSTVQRLLQRARGILVSDRAGAFGFWAMDRRQICLTHLLRKFALFGERRGKGRYLARQLHGTLQIIFQYWHRVRDGTMTRAEFCQWLAPVRDRVEWLLERGAALKGPGFSGVARNILEHREALWTFSIHPGVAPTNNEAERNLRPGVIWRKTSYGTQSDRGERYAERILSVTHTLRKQRRPVLGYLQQACANALYDLPPPSLLPAMAATPSNG
jgi:transposase